MVKHMPKVVLLMVVRYMVICFVMVETMKATENIWEPVFKNILILGFLMADNSLKH